MKAKSRAGAKGGAVNVAGRLVLCAAVLSGLASLGAAPPPAPATGSATPELASPPIEVASPPVEVASPPVEAVRTAVRPRIDGRLDEPAWAAARVFRAFRQTFPDEGTPPVEQTELRVLYDDANLYVGITCLDSEPARINRGLGRRDRPPSSDLVSVMVDSTRSGRTALAFAVNAGGVLRDGLLTDDVDFSTEWDGVWDGAAALRPDGWSAELRIPLSLLRFSALDAQRWNFNVRRELARTHQVIDSSTIPRNANALVSRFGELVGLSGLVPRREVEVSPYVTARGVLRPQYADPARPSPRLLDPTADVGAELKLSLTNSLVLNATVNPDFGQVEADEHILNLTTFEQYYPEKRPFFTEGMDLFAPAGGELGRRTSQQLFYSRRIGLDAPILGAAKLTGELTPGLELGVLDAVVMDAQAPLPLDEDHPDRRLAFHPQRPFHLGPDYELSQAPLAPANFLVAVARGRASDALTLGGTFTSRNAFAPDPVSDNALALDWNLHTPSREWMVLGQVVGSRWADGPPDGRLLADGTLLRPGDTGLGAKLVAGKLGGEPFRFRLIYDYASPRLELNPVGFLRAQNEQTLLLEGQLVRRSRLGFIEELTVALGGSATFTTDSRLLPLTQVVQLEAQALLVGFHSVDCVLGHNLPYVDIREIRGTGVPLERPPTNFVSCSADSDPKQPLSLGADATLERTSARGPLAARLVASGELRSTWRPHPQLQTELSAKLESQVGSPLFVGSAGEDRVLLGEVDARFVSITLRQLLVLTPRLTVQLYGQLFTGYSHYGPFYEAALNDLAPVRLDALQPTSVPDDPSFHLSTLNLNVVLRWELRAGSTLYLILTHAQQELPLDAAAGVLPGALLQGPATTGALLKWTYRWEL